MTLELVPDPIYDDSRLAAVYDALDPDRSDLDHYQVIVQELGARRVLDVGCGTGTLACRLARTGLKVTGVDPAAASVDMARTKTGAELVRWVVGTAEDLPHLSVDIAVMTANVAQVFLADQEWHTTLRAVHGALRPGGHLVFESATRPRSLARVDPRGLTAHGCGA